jgi:hypothetical protein
MLCVEIQKGMMNIREVGNAYSEIVFDEGHASKVENLIIDKFGIDDYLKFVDMVIERKLREGQYES